MGSIMDSVNTKELFAVSAPPFWHRGRTIKSAMQGICIALLPVCLLAIYTWGLPALRVMCLSISICVVTEALCQKILKRDIVVDNFHAVYVGLLFAFLLPANAPWWLVSIGAFLCITFGKMAFGDLGAAPLSSVCVGYVLCIVSFPVYMDANAMQLSTYFVDPLIRLNFFGLEYVKDIPYQDLLLGKQIGGLGTSQAGALLIIGLVLSLFNMVRYEISLSFILGLIVLGDIFYYINPELYMPPLFHLFTGSTLLGAFFLATDYSSSPNRKLNMFIYGFAGGALVIIIRNFGVYTDGVPFAILLINLIMPLLEGKKPKPLGME